MCHPIEIKDSYNAVSGYQFGGPILWRGRRGRGEGTKGGGGTAIFFYFWTGKYY